MTDVPWATVAMEPAKRNEEWTDASGHTQDSVSSSISGLHRLFAPEKLETELTASVLKKRIQNTQEIKRTLFNKTEQDKTCKFSM